jgi:2'-5' RNA ligase
VADPDPQSALIIEVPEAEAAVRQHRDLLDDCAPLGVPAHITVLFPFVPPQAIDDAVGAALARLFADVDRFRFRLDHADWFGDEVLWLGPRDPAPFRALTERVCAAFPAFRPYEGRFEVIVPHLTVGNRRPLQALRAAESVVRARLPIDAAASAVTLIGQQASGGRWTKTASFSLASC